MCVFLGFGSVARGAWIPSFKPCMVMCVYANANIYIVTLPWALAMPCIMDFIIFVLVFYFIFGSLVFCSGIVFYIKFCDLNFIWHDLKKLIVWLVWFFEIYIYNWRYVAAVNGLDFQIIRNFLEIYNVSEGIWLIGLIW